MAMVNEKPHAVMQAKYNVTQAAGLLGISRKTLNRYTKDGKIKAGINKCNNRPMYYGREIIRLWGAEY